MATPSETDAAWPYAQGEMAQRLVQFDWANTPLGPVSGWSARLRMAVELMLASTQPVYIAWGAGLTSLYNDGYIPFLGAKHPDALGQPYALVWPEIWEEYRPIAEATLNGRPHYFKDRPVALQGRAGRPMSWFTFAQTPLRDDAGQVAGFICVATETTDDVLAQQFHLQARARHAYLLKLSDALRPLASAQHIKAAAMRLLGEELGSDCVLYAEHVRRDDTDLWLIENAHCSPGHTLPDGLYPLKSFGRYACETLQGHPVTVHDVSRDPGIDEAAKATFKDLSIAAYAVLPLVKDGKFVALLAMHQATPRQWTALEVALLQETAERTWEAVERARAQAALRDSEERLRLALDAGGMGIFIWDLGSDSLEWDARQYELFGVDSRDREMTGERALARVHPDDRPALESAIRVVVEAGHGTFQFEFRVPQPAGWTRWVAGRAQVVPGLDGRPARMVGLNFDTTKAHEAEEALQRSNAQARLAAERVQLALAAGAIAGTWVWELPTDAVTVDERFAQSFGVDPALGRAGLPLAQVLATVHPDDSAALHAAIGEALLRGGAYRHEYRVRGRDGVYRWVEANGHVELGPDGAAVRFPGVLIDIEQRRALEAERDRALDLLRAFADAVPGVVYAKDREGRLLVANRGLADFVGKPPQALLGKTALEFLDDPIQARAVMAAEQRIMDSGRAEQVEEPLLRPGGTATVWLSTKAPFTDAHGRVIGIIGASFDITQRKTAEEALERLNATLEERVQQRTEQLQAVLHSAGSAIIATDLQGRITLFNPAAEALLGLGSEAAMGQPLLRFLGRRELSLHAHQLPSGLLEATGLKPHRPRPDRRSSRHGEWKCRRADGSVFPAMVSLSMLRNDAGAPVGVLAVASDLSERKALEVLLRQRTAQAEAASQAKSAFLAHMSHELRTPLNAVIGLSQLLQQRQLPEDVARFVGHIHDAGEQLLTLISDVLDLSRIESGEMALEAVAFAPLPLLQSALALVRPQADIKGLVLGFEIGPDLPELLVGDPLRLRQVLFNLLSNAVKFTDVGGLTLRVQVLARSAEEIHLRLDVIDTGIGIAPAHQERIFEPFTQADDSTTRRFGGTGLGLSIVRRLVAMMGGELVLHSMPYQGSTFSVTVRFQVPAAGGARADTS